MQLYVFLLFAVVTCDVLCFKSPLVIKGSTSITSKKPVLLHCSPFFKEQLRLFILQASVNLMDSLLFHLGIISGISHVFTPFFLSSEREEHVSEIYS